MTQDVVMEIMLEAIMLAFKLALPVLLVAMISQFCRLQRKFTSRRFRLRRKRSRLDSRCFLWLRG